MEIQHEACFNGMWLVGFTREEQEVSPEPSASATMRNAYRLRSDNAYSLIALSVEKTLQVHIASTVNPKEAWDIYRIILNLYR